MGHDLHRIPSASKYNATPHYRLRNPISLIRFLAAENIFDFFTEQAPWVRRLPGIKGTNSIFGLPEYYDDLLDEWTHDAHLVERNTD